MAGGLMQQGLELLVFGMGTVFVFLALLVVATNLMSVVVRTWLKGQPPASATPQTVRSGATTDGDDAELFAVIGAALHQHRSRRRR